MRICFREKEKKNKQIITEIITTNKRERKQKK
jgi:hypothetical protein